MTTDDLDRIRGRNERRREELESLVAEECRRSDAMASEFPFITLT